MEKVILYIFVFLFCGINVANAESFLNYLFQDYAINGGLSTFRLIGDNPSIQPQYITGSQTNQGGGLRFIEPGVDVAGIGFLDDDHIQRVVLGFEYFWMNSKEIEYKSITHKTFDFYYHSVQMGGIYLGYHYVFLHTSFRSVKIFAGPDIMCNFLTSNVTERGRHNPDSQYDTYNKYEKNATVRLGARLKLGFDGHIYDRWYLSASGTLGIYNLLLRDDSNGELFNIPSSVDKRESFQPFFNYAVEFQYRF